MSREFEILTEELELLDKSYIVSELTQTLSNEDSIPVLFDGLTREVLNIQGGYNSARDVHILHLFFDKDSLIPDDFESIEIHSDTCWTIEFTDAFEQQSEQSRCLTVEVLDYQRIPYSFKEALQEDIDRREQQHSYY
jgi:hypothetical protein